MRSAAILFLFAGVVRPGCVAVPSDKILARDLAPVVPVFRTLTGDEIIGFSPFPGTERVLSGHDILLAIRHYGLALTSGEQAPSICIQRITRIIHAEEIRTALLSALDGSVDRTAIALEVLEFSNKPVPPGKLVFQLVALNKPPGNNPQMPVIWPGKLVYDDQNSLAVWAKVRISAERETFLAKEAIPKGQVIRADQISATRIQQFPWPASPPASEAGIVGKVARRAIPAGQRIATDTLADPQDVTQGETVHVKVVDGAATITLDAMAQSSGTRGDNILVHNPSSGKSFRAVIEDRKQVVVVSTPRSDL